MNKTFKQFLIELETKTPNMPEFDTDAAKAQIEKLMKNPKHVFQGAGYQGYVYSDDQVPGEVNRVADKSDATTKFLRYLHDNPQLQNNQFMPKIKRVIDIDSDVPTFVLEHLYSITGTPFSVDVLNQVLNQYFTRFPNIYNSETNSVNYQLMADKIAEYITHCIDYDNMDIIRDPALKEAILIIKKAYAALQRGRTLKIDIKHDNIMWRKNGDVPHLVITDPLWSF